MLMGAGKARIMRTITLPLIIPSLGAAALLVFVRAIGNFGIPAVIGGNNYVLPTLIKFAYGGAGDINLASSIAVINVIITGLVLYVQKYIVNRHEYETISASHTDIKQHESVGARVFAIILCVVGKEYLVSLQLLTETDSFFFYIISTAFSFAANLAILQLGVRTMVAELTVSFKGISDKLLPSAVPGVDCAVSFSFGSPNAVTIGFLFGALGETIAMLLLVIFHSPTIVICGFIPMFFDNATIAVYANSKGGTKAACLFPFISGFIQVFGSAFIATWTGLAKYGGYLGMWDWAVIWPAFTVAMKYLSWIGLALVVVFLIAIVSPQAAIGAAFGKEYGDYKAVGNHWCAILYDGLLTDALSD